MADVLGIDVSNYQGVIDWRQVADSGIKFAFMKCTEGRTYFDPYFERNWKGSKDNGLYRGGYHFARPDLNSDARTESDWFYDHFTKFGPLQTGDMIALDMEVS